MGDNTPKPKPKFAIGELVMVRSTAAPELNTNCTEVLNSRYRSDTRRLDGSKADPGWKYQLAHQPMSPNNPKKRLWFREESLRKIGGPKTSVTDFLQSNFPSFNKTKEPVKSE